MKKITKDNNGITLVALIMTIVIMLILVSVTTYTGIDTYKNAQITKFVTQMQLLQSKIDELANSGELTNIVGEMQPITAKEQNIINTAYRKNGEISTDSIEKYKVLTREQVLNILDVEDIQNSIIVNIETREILSEVGIEYDGTMYYTQYKLPNGQKIINKSNNTSRDLSFNPKISVDGLNATITIDDIKIANGTLSFYEKDSEENKFNFQTITNYTEKGNTYTTNISKSGNYVFRLADNTNNEDYIENNIKVVVTNKPKTNLNLETYNYGLNSSKWAYLDKNSVNYVWIPRFIYKTNGDNSIEIKFIKGNSNIATDNTYVSEEWILHDKFKTENGNGLTGVWVEIENTNQEGLDMIELLNDNSKNILTSI